MNFPKFPVSFSSENLELAGLLCINTRVIRSCSLFNTHTQNSTGSKPLQVVRVHTKSLDFIIYRTLVNIFETFSHDIINECLRAFNLPLVTDIIGKQKNKFHGTLFYH